MGSNWAQPVSIGRFEQIAYRVILVINRTTGVRSASIMLGKNGDTILETENDEDETVGKVLGHTGTGEFLNCDGL